jgi:hypothetical protein
MMIEQSVDRDFHASYSGSGIHRLLAGCYGSVRLARTVPPAPPSPWQAEGTEAHAELETAIKRVPHATRKHWKSIEHVIDYVASIGNPKTVLSEQRVIFPQDIVPPMECSGTLDVCVITGRRAWVIDYKHGAGEYVRVEENAQLMFYAWAALHSMLHLLDEITLVVVQPNTWRDEEPVREHRVTPLELFEFAIAVKDAIVQAERLHAPLLAGEHCKFCPAGPNCDARERSAIVALTHGAGTSIREWQPADLPKASELDLARLGEIVVKADGIRAWLKTVEDYAEARAKAGEIEVPGCKVVEAGARRQVDWTTRRRRSPNRGLANILASMVRPCRGEDARARSSAPSDKVYPRKLIGITDAEKLVVEAATRGLETPEEKRAAVAKAKVAFSALTTKESSGALSLVPLSDPRPPVNRAAKHFGGVIVKGLD